MKFFVYILRSKKNGKFYIGQTNNLSKRIIQHNAGYSLSTKSGRPWELVCSENYDDRSLAMKRESELKRKKSKIYIENLIQGV